MRRAVDFWRRIGTWTNLETALAQALRGKRTRRDVQEFLRRLSRDPHWTTTKIEPYPTRCPESYLNMVAPGSASPATSG